ncbi:MAG TPA: hypothetical protein VHO27_15720 [Angustibacter sp.]|nr:hypothetical protein [Angustibacter sp.]
MSDDELKGYQADATHNTGVPSATVPGAPVEVHGGHVKDEERADGTYVDGNVDERGVDAQGPSQAEIAEGSVDEAVGTDISPRTDGRGQEQPDVEQVAADASVPNDVHPGAQH